MADPQSFDRLAADCDRYASLEPPLILDWLLTQLSWPRPARPGRRLRIGRHTLALADRFDQVVGVDRSQPLIDLARRTRPHPRIRYRTGDLLAIRDPEGFDLVFSSTTLHHLPDLEAALAHLRRLVAPGGPGDPGRQRRPTADPTPLGLPVWERSVTSPPTCDATASRRRGGG